MEGLVSEDADLVPWYLEASRTLRTTKVDSTLGFCDARGQNKNAPLPSPSRLSFLSRVLSRQAERKIEKPVG